MIKCTNNIKNVGNVEIMQKTGEKKIKKEFHNITSYLS